MSPSDDHADEIKKDRGHRQPRGSAATRLESYRRAVGCSRRSGLARALPQGFANPFLDTERVQTIVVVVTSAVEAAIAHVGGQYFLTGHTGLGFRKMPPPESPEQT